MIEVQTSTAIQEGIIIQLENGLCIRMCHLTGDTMFDIRLTCQRREIGWWTNFKRDMDFYVFSCCFQTTPFHLLVRAEHAGEVWWNLKNMRVDEALRRCAMILCNDLFFDWFTDDWTMFKESIKANLDVGIIALVLSQNKTH